MNSTTDVWKSNDLRVWEDALDRYWLQVGAGNQQLEESLNSLDIDSVRGYSPTRWYNFLLEEYFPWKYTDPRWLKTTTRELQEKCELMGLVELDNIRRRLLSLDTKDIIKGLGVARQIPGLGVPGASGLLAIMYPKYFGTVDVFVVDALARVFTLPERDEIIKMKGRPLSNNKQGELLIRIMRRKAADLNHTFESTQWSPRKVDMVLWACRDEQSSRC